MNKRRWTYIGEGGSRSTIGLIHNTSKGQFMIYCNKKIVLVEFKLYHSKQFSFFLEEELFKIDVIKNENNTYDYTFKVDLEAKTPLNAERAQLKKSTLKQSIIAIVVSLAVVAIIISTVIGLHSRQLRKVRQDHGAYTTAQMYINQTQSNSFSLGYSFATKYRDHFHQIEFYKEQHPMSPTGFPFYDGDEFYVQYALNDASNHEIFYNQPTERQIKVYQKRALQKHLEINSPPDTAYCRCLIEKAYLVDKVDGLAHFYHQETPPSQNRKFNIKTYKELIYSEDFKKEADGCLHVRE